METITQAPEIELASLWSNEGDDIGIHIEGSSYFETEGHVILWLTSDSTNRYDLIKPDGVDEVTLTWSFYGNSITEVVSDALEFARALAALKPPDD